MSTTLLDKEEDSLRSTVTGLQPEHRKYYYELERTKIKDPDTYAALNYIVIGGLHHFYLGKWLFGLLNLIGTLVGFMTFTIGGWALIVFVLVIELPQLFRSQSIVKRWNNAVMAETLRETRIHFGLAPRI